MCSRGIRRGREQSGMPEGFRPSRSFWGLAPLIHVYAPTGTYSPLTSERERPSLPSPPSAHQGRSRRARRDDSSLPIGRRGDVRVQTRRVRAQRRGGTRARPRRLPRGPRLLPGGDGGFDQLRPDRDCPPRDCPPVVVVVRGHPRDRGGGTRRGSQRESKGVRAGGRRWFRRGCVGFVRPRRRRCRVVRRAVPPNEARSIRPRALAKDGCRRRPRASPASAAAVRSRRPRSVRVLRQTVLPTPSGG